MVPVVVGTAVAAAAVQAEHLEAEHSFAVFAELEADSEVDLRSRSQSLLRYAVQLGQQCRSAVAGKHRR